MRPPSPKKDEVDEKSLDYYFLAALSASRRLTHFQTLPCETSTRCHQIVCLLIFYTKINEKEIVCQCKIIKRSVMGEYFVYCLARLAP